VYLAKLTIERFRKLAILDIECRAGLNVFVGPNNVGKTAIVDALRALLSTTDESFLRIPMTVKARLGR
jgi:putative ATP-dependent endonuclease of OLD family